MQSDRRSTKKGAGITFADYAQYSFGDDYRSIDWRVYAKFESLLIKLFELEEDATIYLLVDLQPLDEHSKQAYAKQLAAALGYIALNTLDRLAVYGLADHSSRSSSPARGRNQVIPFLRSLEAPPTSVPTPISTPAHANSKPGIAAKVSSASSLTSCSPAVSRKASAACNGTSTRSSACKPRTTTTCAATWKGDMTLECVETGQTQRVTVSPRTRGQALRGSHRRMEQQTSSETDLRPPRHRLPPATNTDV